jgi:hypothetical protein
MPIFRQGHTQGEQTRDKIGTSLRFVAFTHASHPDPFEANGMPPTYDSMHSDCIDLNAAERSTERLD